ncbi:MAG: hypothetical protein WD512_03660, partial [Candidatus Paceibacterota bacterium]
FIDNPHLMQVPKLYPNFDLRSDQMGNFLRNQKNPNTSNLEFKHKYNIRFYVLLVMGSLPTFGSLGSNSSNGTTGSNRSKAAMDSDAITAYLFKDFVTYFSILPYHKGGKHDFQHLSEDMIDNMRKITNLELINTIYDENARLNVPNIDKTLYKQNLTALYSDLVDPSSFKKVKDQARIIAKQTIDSVKYNLRPLNRYAKNGFKAGFNLLAYDTLLDDNNKLWLIEVNRGPDLVGLQTQYGDSICTEIFDEIFSLSVDKFLKEVGKDRSREDLKGIEERKKPKTKKLKYFNKIKIEYKGLSGI